MLFVLTLFMLSQEKCREEVCVKWFYWGNKYLAGCVCWLTAWLAGWKAGRLAAVRLLLLFFLLPKHTDGYQRKIIKVKHLLHTLYITYFINSLSHYYFLYSFALFDILFSLNHLPFCSITNSVAIKYWMKL